MLSYLPFFSLISCVRYFFASSYLCPLHYLYFLYCSLLHYVLRMFVVSVFHSIYSVMYDTLLPVMAFIPVVVSFIASMILLI